MRERETILVVDDEPSLLFLHRLVLEASGYTVLEASDGAEALERLRSESTQLVVTDLMMPVLDGCGLISSMRAAPELRTIPVIVVTASTIGTIEGASAILKKPCDPDTLLAAASAALSERRD